MTRIGDSGMVPEAFNKALKDTGSPMPAKFDKLPIGTQRTLLQATVKQALGLEWEPCIFDLKHVNTQNIELLINDSVSPLLLESWGKIAFLTEHPIDIKSLLDDLPARDYYMLQPQVVEALAQGIESDELGSQDKKRCAEALMRGIEDYMRPDAIAANSGIDSAVDAGLVSSDDADRARLKAIFTQVERGQLSPKHDWVTMEVGRCRRKGLVSLDDVPKAIVDEMYNIEWPKEKNPLKRFS